MSVVDRARALFWPGSTASVAPPPAKPGPEECAALRARGRMLMSERDAARLQGVHPDLVRVVEHARACGMPFSVLEGLRTLGRQQELVRKGASKTMNSRHLTGHAVDIAPTVDGGIRWDWPLYYELAPVVKAAAAAEGVPIEWGGDWTSFKDGPHWQLPWDKYP